LSSRSTSVKQFFPRACVAIRFRRAGCGLLSGRLAPLRQQIDDVDREIQEMKSVKARSVKTQAQVQIREARREKDSEANQRD